MRLFFLHQHRSDDEARAAAAVAAPAAPASLRNDTAIGLPPSGAAAAGWDARSPTAATAAVVAAAAAAGAAGLLSPSPPPGGGARLGDYGSDYGGGYGSAGGYSSSAGPSGGNVFGCSSGFGPSAAGLLPFGFTSDPSPGSSGANLPMHQPPGGGYSDPTGLPSGLGGPEGGAAGLPAGMGLGDDEGPVILHVSGLVEGVTREQLRELFGRAGEVTKVDIPDGGRSMVSFWMARVWFSWGE
jgi:hypothetical protein